jgi:ABC-type glycerol-3-phosphate transport system permease component
MNDTAAHHPPRRFLHSVSEREAFVSSLRRWARYGWVYLCVILLVAIVGGPFYWMFISSLKAETELLAQPPTLFPHAPVFRAYRTLIDTGFLTYLQNSLVVSLITVVISTAPFFLSLSRRPSHGANVCPGKQSTAA